MNETIAEFDADTKESLLKSTKDLFFAAKQLHEWVRDNQLNVEMKSTLASLIESHFVDVSKLTGYESHLAKEHERRFVDIRNANGRIHELEKMLGSAKPIDGLKEQLRGLYDIIRDWWNEEGFHHISELQFTEGGHVKLQFNFMLDFFSSMSDKPDSERKSRAEHVEGLRERGFDIRNVDGEKLKVIDNAINRSLLSEMLTARFPSIKIIEYKNHCAYKNTELFILRHVEAYIYDLKDIPAGSEAIEP